MTKLIGTLLVSGTLAALPGMARPQVDERADSPRFVAENEAETVPPPAAAPSEAPPAPPFETPAPPPPQEQAPSSLPAGQWVYTQQYGWIWMAYSDDYTHVPSDGYGEPYAYAYYPLYGWTWLAAPWVWGFGPWPTFGLYGPARFGWYGHGWWRDPARWHYAPSRGGYYGGRPAPPAYRGSPGRGSFRPAPYRSGAGYRGSVAPPHVGQGGRGGVGAAGFHPGNHAGWPGFGGRAGSGGHGSSGGQGSSGGHAGSGGHGSNGGHGQGGHR
jgi:hypothetical protein